MPDLSLLDLVALNNGDPIIGLVESAVFSYPELSILDAVPHPGTGFDVCRRTAIPTVQFSNSGAGTPTVKSTYVLERKPMFLMEPQLEVPMSIIAAQNRAVGDILAIEAKGVMDAVFFHLTQQFYYGNNVKAAYGGTAYVADPLGFSGYCDMVFGDTNFELSAGGANGSSTSCYLVCCHEKGASLAVGNEGSMNLLPWTQQQIVVSGQNKLQAMVSAFMGWFGLTLANEWTVWRIKGIDPTHPLTDALVSSLLALVPIQYRVNMHLFVNRFGSSSLQASRSSVTQQPADGTGSVGWSPEPTKSNGIPICTTEAITNTERV